MPIKITSKEDHTVFIGGHPLKPGLNTISNQCYEAMIQKVGGVLPMAEQIAAITPPHMFGGIDKPMAPKPKRVARKWKAKELAELTFKQLKEAAKFHGIKGRSKLDLCNSLEGKVK